MKKYKIAMIISLAVAMLTFGACSKAKENVKPTVNTNSESTKKVVEASGSVRSSNIENIVIDLPAGANARISKFDVREGSKVKKGDKLAELDLADYNAMVTQKGKTIDADKSMKKDMTTGNQKKAQDFKIESEQVELDALKSKVNKGYIDGGSIISDMDNAVVTDISYKQGDVINSQMKVLTLQDLSNLVIVANVDEEFIRDVQEGKAVTILPKADPSLKLSGKVTRIYNTAVSQSGETYIPVEISIDSNRGKLLPSYNVDVEIEK